MIDRLHYISQEHDNLTHIQAIEAALDAGCKWIQLRVKNQSEEAVRANAERAKQLCDLYGARLIINDHPHIAKEVSAYGVHVGLQDLPVADARQLTGKEIIIGGTANTLEHIKLRIQEGADYIGLGPFRFTTTKEKLSPVLGLDGYRKIMEQMRSEGLQIPVIAIGAIGLEDVEPLMSAGVHGVAISGSITRSPERAKLVKELYSLLQ